MLSDENNIPTYTVHDDLCKAAQLTAKWVNGSTLSVFAYDHKTYDSADKPSKFTNMAPVIIHHLKTKFIYDEPILRGLLAESNSIFQELQQQQSKTNSPRPEYLKISQTYRSIIRGCLQKLQKEMENDANHLYQDFITIFYSIECLWHLCEIFLIDSVPSNFAVPHLIDWIRFHFPAAEQRATELLFVDRYESEPSDKEYFRVVKSLVVQGHLDVARTILQFYGRNHFNASFQMTEEILRTVPIYSVSGGLSLQNWRSQWQYWVADTESKLEMGCFESEPELKEIVELVTGNETTWSNLATESTCWYEHFPGFLFYTQPNCTYYQLGTLAENWLRRWLYARGDRVENTSGSSLKHLDRVILKIMQNDLHQVLRDIQNMCDQQWFATHLTDLLWHCGKLNIFSEDHNDFSVSLRDSLLFDFGAMLMSKDSFWIFGLDYLDQCSVEGTGAIELFLPKIVIQNEKQALKVINVAKSRGLIEVEKEICRVQAVQNFKNQRYGNALDWALRSQDNIYVTLIADLFLRHYAKTGEILCRDVILNVGAKMFISPRLVFLVKYYDFQHFYRRELFPQAAELLVNLLDSKIAPGYFWPSMFADTIPMLEAVDPIFSSKETYKIMYYLENQLVPLLEKFKKSLIKHTNGDSNAHNMIEWEPLLQKVSTNNSTADKTSSKHSLVEKVSFMVKLIRRSCIRNISRALIIENTNI